MVPQSMKQNSGPWARIEKDTRSYASRAKGDVYIITGPVFDPKPSTVGDNKVARVSKPISYAELVKRTGIEFLPGVQPH